MEGGNSQSTEDRNWNKWITPDEAGQLEIMAHDGRKNPTHWEAHGMCNGLQHH